MKGGSRAVYMLAAAVFFTLLTKLGALARDMVLAALFGAGIDVDAYFLANVVPGLLWLAMLTTIAAVFLPMYVAARHRGEAEAARLAVEAVRTYVFLGICMFLVTLVAARPIIELSAPNDRPELINLAVELTQIMGVGFMFTGYVGVQNAIQQANGRYLWPLAAQPLNHLVTIAMMFVAATLGSIKIAVAGAVVGWVIQAPLQRRQTRAAYRSAPGFKVRRETLQRLVLLSGPVIVGVFLDQANSYIGIAIAAHLGPGAVSHLGFASRLALFLGNLVSWLTAYFLFPRLAAHAARRDSDATARDLGAGVIIICGLTLPMLVVSLLFAREMIAIVYGRGAFGAADVAATAAVFLPYVLGIVAIGLREMLNRVFFSYQRTTAPMVIGVISALANLGLSLWLSRRFGVPGIALGATGAAMVYVLLQVGALLSWRQNLVRLLALARFAALLLASAVTYFAVQPLLPLIPHAPLLGRVAIGSLLAGLIYLMLVAVLDRLLRLDLSEIVCDLKGSSIPAPQAVSADPEPI